MKEDTKSLPEIIKDKDLEYSFLISDLEQHNHTATGCRASYNRIFLIEEGMGTLFIDDLQFIIEGGELFLLGKNQVFFFSNCSGLKGYEIRFGDFFWEKSPASANNCKSALFSNVAKNQRIPLSGSELAKLKPVIGTLYSEYLGDTYINKLDALAAYLKIIMIKIANINALLADAFDSYEKQVYRKFKDMLSKKYLDMHEVGAYAAQLGITTRKLTDLCKTASGKGAKEIIDEHIISEAKRSLQFSSKPIKEIAYNLNFSSPEQFSHFFKRITRCSPDYYRSQFV